MVRICDESMGKEMKKDVGTEIEINKGQITKILERGFFNLKTFCKI